MPIPDTASKVHCQNCGTQWDANTHSLPMHYFSPRVVDPGEYSSISEIIAAGYILAKCPKCPIEKIDAAMRSGANRKTEGDDPLGEAPGPMQQIFDTP